MGGIGNFRRKLDDSKPVRVGKKNAVKFAVANLHAGRVHVRELQTVRSDGSEAIQGDGVKMSALMLAASKHMKWQARVRAEEKAKLSVSATQSQKQLQGGNDAAADDAAFDKQK